MSVFYYKGKYYKYQSDIQNFKTWDFSMKDFQLLDFPIWGSDYLTLIITVSVIIVLLMIVLFVWLFKRSVKKKIEKAQLKVLKTKTMNQAFTETETSLIQLLINANSTNHNVEISDINHVLGIKDKNKPTFKDFGIRKDSSELSTKNNGLTVKFSDDENSYTIFIKVNTDSVAQDIAAFPKEDNKDFGIDDIKKCIVFLRKTNIDTFKEIGIDKTVDVKSLDEEYLINLMIELDDMFGDFEKLEIETK